MSELQTNLVKSEDLRKTRPSIAESERVGSPPRNVFNAEDTIKRQDQLRVINELQARAPLAASAAARYAGGGPLAYKHYQELIDLERSTTHSIGDIAKADFVARTRKAEEVKALKSERDVSLMESFSRNWQYGWDMLVKRGELGAQLMEGDQSAQAGVDYLESKWQGHEIQDSLLDPRTYAGVVSQSLPMMLNAADEAAEGATAGLGIGLAAGPKGALAWAGRGALYGMFKANSRLYAGLNYLDYKNAVDAEGNQLSDEYIRDVAGYVGVLQAGIESVGVGLLFKVAGGAQLLNAITNRSIQKIALSQTQAAALGRTAAKLAGAGGVEALTEGVQEGVNIIGLQALEALDEEFGQAQGTDFTGQILESAKLGFAGGLVMGGPSAVATGLVDASNVMQHNVEIDRIDKLADAAVDHKLREEAPEFYNQVLKEEGMDGQRVIDNEAINDFMLWAEQTEKTERVRDFMRGLGLDDLTKSSTKRGEASFEFSVAKAVSLDPELTKEIARRSRSTNNYVETNQDGRPDEYMEMLNKELDEARSDLDQSVLEENLDYVEYASHTDTELKRLTQQATEAINQSPRLVADIAKSGKSVQDYVRAHVDLMRQYAYRHFLDTTVSPAETLAKLTEVSANPNLTDRRGIIERDNKTGTYKINLGTNADISTLTHELSHLWLLEAEAAAQVDGVAEQLKTAVKTLKEKYGEGRDGAEKMADDLTVWLSDGVAPSQRLARAFALVRHWMSAIFKQAEAEGDAISPDARSAFQRIMLTDQQIEEAHYINSQMPMTRKQARELGVPDSEFDNFLDDVMESRRAGALRLIQKSVQESGALSKEMEKEAKEKWFAKRIVKSMTFAESSGGMILEDIVDVAGEEVAEAIQSSHPEVIGTELSVRAVAFETGYKEPGDMLVDMSVLPTQEQFVKTYVAREINRRNVGLPMDAAYLQTAAMGQSMETLAEIIDPMNAPVTQHYEQRAHDSLSEMSYSQMNPTKYANDLRALRKKIRKKAKEIDLLPEEFQKKRSDLGLEANELQAKADAAKTEAGRNWKMRSVEMRDRAIAALPEEEARAQRNLLNELSRLIDQARMSKALLDASTKYESTVDRLKSEIKKYGRQNQRARTEMNGRLLIRSMGIRLGLVPEHEFAQDDKGMPTVINEGYNSNQNVGQYIGYWDNNMQRIDDGPMGEAPFDLWIMNNGAAQPTDLPQGSEKRSQPSPVVQYEDLSPAQLETLRMAINYIHRVSRQKMGDIDYDRDTKLSLTDAINAVAEELEEKTKGQKDPVINPEQRKGIMARLREYAASNTQLYTILSLAGPRTEKIVYDMLERAMQRTDEIRREYYNEFRDVLDYMNQLRLDRESVDVPDRYKPNEYSSVTKSQLFMLAIYGGNTQQFNVITRDWNMGEYVNTSQLNSQQVGNTYTYIDDTGVSKSWVADRGAYEEVVNLLSDEDLLMLNKVWKAFEHMRPGLQKSVREAFGDYARPVPARSFEIRGIKLTGGFFPQRYSNINAVPADMTSGAGAERTANIVRGSSIERQFLSERRPATGYQLRLDGINILTEYLEDTVNFRGMRVPLKNALALLNNPRIDNLMNKRVGVEMNKAAKRIIQKGLNQAVEYGDTTDKIVDHLRLIGQHAALTASPKVALMQPASLANAVPVVGIKYLVKSLFNTTWMKWDPIKDIREESPTLDLRSGNFEELRQMRTRLRTMPPETNYEKAIYALDKAASLVSRKLGIKSEVVNDALWFFIKWFDSMAARVVYDAAKMKALDEGKTERDARFAADKAVVTTQPARRMLDEPLSIKQRKGIARLFTMFMSGANQATNKNYYYAKLLRENPRDPKAWNGMFYTMIVQGTWIFMAREVFAQMTGVTDEEDDVYDMLIRWGVSIGTFPAGGLFAVREVVNALTYIAMREKDRYEDTGKVKAVGRDLEKSLLTAPAVGIPLRLGANALDALILNLGDDNIGKRRSAAADLFSIIAATSLLPGAPAQLASADSMYRNWIKPLEEEEQ